MANLEKRYGEFSLSVQSLTLFPGRIHGLIGPNGSGKTTLMKLMAGLVKPDSGEIDYAGLTWRDMTMITRKPYFLHDTVLRNLTYPLALRGIKPDPEQIDRYLERIGLAERRRQYAPSLSAGEQQKLSLMRALIFSPKLILADEAFSALDIESVCMSEQLILNRQREQPITWVVISHQLSHIQRLCDYVCFMDNGQLAAEGPVGDMLLLPQHPRLRRYLQHESVLVSS